MWPREIMASKGLTKFLHFSRVSSSGKALLTSLADSHSLKVGIIGGGRLGKQLARALVTVGQAPCSSVRISTRRPESLCKCSPAGPGSGVGFCCASDGPSGRTGPGVPFASAESTGSEPCVPCCSTPAETRAQLLLRQRAAGSLGRRPVPLLPAIAHAIHLLCSAASHPETLHRVQPHHCCPSAQVKCTWTCYHSPQSSRANTARCWHSHCCMGAQLLQHLMILLQNIASNLVVVSHSPLQLVTEGVGRGSEAR